MLNKFDPKYLKKQYPNHEIKFEVNDSKGEGKYGKIHPVTLKTKYRPKTKFDFIKKIFRPKEKNKKEIFRIRNFVIKKFKSKNLRNHSIKIWKLIENFKIPTFKIYKMYGKLGILMEDLSLNEKFCISTVGTNQNEKNLDHMFLSENKIEKVINFEEFLEKVYNCFELFEKIQLVCEMYYDFLFIIGDKKPVTSLDIIVGDFDRVFLETELSDEAKYTYLEREKYYKEEFSYRIVIRFIENYLIEENRALYRKITLKYFDKKKNENIGFKR